MDAPATIEAPAQQAPAADGIGSLLGGVSASPPAAPVSQPGYVLPDGKFADGWLDRLPPELRGNPALTTMPDLPSLAKSYVETKGMVGRKLEAPSELSTPEQIASWRKTVGAPESPEAYGEALQPDDLPAELWNKDEAAKFAKDVALKHHLPPKAVKDIMNFYGSTLKQGLERQQQEEVQFKEAEMGKLRKEWGANFDAEAHHAMTFAKAIGLNPETTPDFGSSEFVLAMARGAKMLMGDKLVAGTPPTISSSVETRIRSVMESPEYRGERGAQAQAQAQQQLHDLYNARKQ